MILKIQFLVFSVLLLAACQQRTTHSILSEEDQKAIRAVNEAYTKYWLSNDEEKLLDLFLDDATIMPSGMEPKNGISEIREFWFPDDSSKTTVHSYRIDINDLSGSGHIAHTREEGFLSFSYEKGDFKMSRESHSHAITTYQKQSDGNWKISSRIWTDVK